MKNLGKITLLLLILSTFLDAKVTARVTPYPLYAGDSATYILTIDGKNIKKPSLLDICGNTITATASQTSIESINGEYHKSYTLSYDFTPYKECEIAPTAVMIDGKKEFSNSVKLSLAKSKRDVDAPFLLTLKSSKESLYVGEPFTLTLTLKQRLGAQVVDSKFIAPEFKGFWLKSESPPKREQDATYLTTTLHYRLAPQRAGLLEITPAKLKIATRLSSNNWGRLMPQVKWHTYFSNSNKIEVKPLPNNAKLIGDFSLTAESDKVKVNPNEAVNVILKVQGEGNLEDIESFKPYISGVNIFAEKSNIQADTLTQKLVFVADNNFTIPAFTLTYFDTRTQKVKRVKTKPIEIEVVGSTTQANKLEIKREHTTKETTAKVEKIVVKERDIFSITLAFILGVFVGGALLFLLPKSRKKRVVKVNLKDEKALLVRLLPYKESDAEVASLVAILEENIYAKEKQRVDKKLLKKVLEKYKIS